MYGEELHSDDMPTTDRFFITQIWNNSNKHHIYDAKEDKLVCGLRMSWHKPREKGHVDAQGARIHLGNLTKWCSHCMNRVED